MNLKAQETAKVLIKILEENPKFIPKMRYYCSLLHEKMDVRDKSKHTCKTTYCLAGLLAHEKNYPEEFHSPKKLSKFDYTEFSYDSVDDEIIMWEFMFSHKWEDCREHAIDRLNYVATFGEVPTGWDGKEYKDFLWDADDE